MKKESYYGLGNISLLIILGAVAVIVFFMKMFTGSGGMKVTNTGFTIIVVIGGVLLYKYSQAHKKNKTQYDKLIVEKAVQEFLPGASIQPDVGVDASKLYQLGVVPAFNRQKGSYLLQYSKNGQSCCLSNLELDYKTEEKIHTVFDGQAYILGYKSQIPGYVRVMPTYRDNITNREIMSGYRKPSENEHKIELENQLFNENFDVYATDEESAFYVLTPYVMEQLLEMKEKHGYFGMAVNRNEIAIAFNSNYELFAIPHKYDKIDQISVETTIGEIRNMLNFAQSIEDAINGKVVRR